jgi:hypothetical protein
LRFAFVFLGFSGEQFLEEAKSLTGFQGSLILVTEHKADDQEEQPPAEIVEQYLFGELRDDKEYDQKKSRHNKEGSHTIDQFPVAIPHRFLAPDGFTVPTPVFSLRKMSCGMDRRQATVEVLFAF